MKRQTTRIVMFGAKAPRIVNIAEQKKIELIDEASPELIGEPALGGSADEHSDRGGADDGGGAAGVANPDAIMSGNSEPCTM